eukprot:jgi/Bigna1/85834/estExt_fgenesh1_pg.C_60222
MSGGPSRNATADAHFSGTLRPGAESHLPSELRMNAPRTRNLKSMPMNWRSGSKTQQIQQKTFLPKLDQISPRLHPRQHPRPQSASKRKASKSTGGAVKKKSAQQAKLRKSGDSLFQPKTMSRRQFASTRTKMMENLKRSSPYAGNPRVNRGYGKEMMASFSGGAGRPDYNKIGSMALKSRIDDEEEEDDMAPAEREKIKLQTSHSAWGNTQSPKREDEGGLFSSAAMVLSADPMKPPSTRGSDAKGAEEKKAEVRPFYMQVLKNIDNKQRQRLNASSGMSLELDTEPERELTEEEKQKIAEENARREAAEASKVLFSEVSAKDAKEEKVAIEEIEKEEEQDVFASVIQNKELEAEKEAENADPLTKALRRIEILELQLAQSQKIADEAKLESKRHLKFARVSKRDFEQQMIDSLTALRETEKQLDNSKADLKRVGEARQRAVENAESARLETAAMQEKLKDMRQEQENTLALLLKTNREIDFEDPLNKDRNGSPIIAEDASRADSIQEQVQKLRTRQQGERKKFSTKLDALRDEYFQQNTKQRLAYQEEMNTLQQRLATLENYNKQVEKDLLMVAQINDEVSSATADAKQISHLTGLMGEQSSKNRLLELLQQALEHGSSYYMQATIEAAVAFGMKSDELERFRIAMERARELERLAKDALAEKVARLEMRELGYNSMSDFRAGKKMQKADDIDLYKVDPRLCPISLGQPICIKGKSCRCEGQGLDLNILRVRLEEEGYCPVKVSEDGGDEDEELHDDTLSCPMTMGASLCWDKMEDGICLECGVNKMGEFPDGEGDTDGKSEAGVPSLDKGAVGFLNAAAALDRMLLSSSKVEVGHTSAKSTKILESEATSRPQEAPVENKSSTEHFKAAGILDDIAESSFTKSAQEIKNEKTNDKSSSNLKAAGIDNIATGSKSQPSGNVEKKEEEENVKRGKAEQKQEEKSDNLASKTAGSEAKEPEVKKKEEVEGKETKSPEATKAEAEKKEAEKQEAEKKESDKPDTAKVEAEKKEAEKQEAEKKESDKPDTAKAEAEKQEAEKKESDKPDAAKAEAEKQEAEKKESDKPDTAKAEAEKKEAEKQEAEKKESDKPDTAKAEAEKKEAEKKEAEKQEAEKKESDKPDTAKAEAEKKEANEKESEKLDAAKAEAEKKEAEKKESDKPDAAKAEAEKQEAEKKESEKPDTAKAEAEKKEAEKQEAEKKESDKPDTAKAEAEKKEAEKKEAEKKEANEKESEKPDAAKAEAEKQEAEKKESDKPDAAKAEAEKKEAEKKESEKPDATKTEAQK